MLINFILLDQIIIIDDDDEEDILQDILTFPPTHESDYPNEFPINHLGSSSSAPSIQTPNPPEPNMEVPISIMTQIMKKIFQTSTKITQDNNKDSIQQCVTEFTHLVIDEAKVRSQKEHRDTTKADDIIWAMRNMGFHDYIQPITSLMNQYLASQTGPNPAQFQPDKIPESGPSWMRGTKPFKSSEPVGKMVPYESISTLETMKSSHGSGGPKRGSGPAHVTPQEALNNDSDAEVSSRAHYMHGLDE